MWQFGCTHSKKCLLATPERLASAFHGTSLSPSHKARRMVKMNPDKQNKNKDYVNHFLLLWMYPHCDWSLYEYTFSFLTFSSKHDAIFGWTSSLSSITNFIIVSMQDLTASVCSGLKYTAEKNHMYDEYKMYTWIVTSSYLEKMTLKKSSNSMSDKI
jgi:hypothetical protein